jgi:hypothetical protein
MIELVLIKHSVGALKYELKIGDNVFEVQSFDVHEHTTVMTIYIDNKDIKMVEKDKEDE